MIENDFIRNYWNSQAEKFKDSHWASWGDHFMVDLEINVIDQHIVNGNLVLDIGCANGYSTFRQYLNGKAKSIVGIDFSERMIAEAIHAKKEQFPDVPLSFEVGDVRKLRFEAEYFDVVYTTRCLINLHTWDEQISGIDEALRVTKKGGKTVLSEGFWEPLALLNSFRLLKQLPPLVEHDFNRYLKKEKLESYLASKSLKYKVEDFSSIYYLGSRFLRELITDATKYPGFSNPINELFYEIEKNYSGGGFGIQQAYIIYKE